MVSALVNASNFMTGRALPMVLSSGEGAGGASLASLSSSLVDGLKSIAMEMLTAVGQLIPVVLLVVGGVAVVKFGINMFKKFGSAT